MTTINAEPTKSFFIDMITRDIGLPDCIYDLIDNCLDGAAAENHRLKNKSGILEGFKTSVEITKNKFSIKDNCGGISKHDAINYAFHFGRDPKAPPEKTNSIGLYGIGMKRAIFKIGKQIKIVSETHKEAFEVNIDVKKWAVSTDWKFELKDIQLSGKLGTSIEVTEIAPEVAENFSDDAFINSLHKSIAQYYAIFLENGFKVLLNQKSIKPFQYEFEVSESITPSNYSYIDEKTKVKVQIIAGLASLPTDDSSAESKQRKPENWGWYVVCNDRVVLAADKTKDTIWGRNNFATWHPQYNGFMGIVKFESKNTSLLPWTTTKREIDQSNGVYNRALVKMKEATRPVISYTTERKENKISAKEIELKAISVPVRELKTSKSTITPILPPRTQAVGRISFTKSTEIISKVKVSFGRRAMSNKDVGIRTFDYYVENEIED